MPDAPFRLPAGLLATVAVVAAGGVLGAELRFVLSLLLPHPPSAWPWATLATNASGCLLIGMLMVVVTERTRAHPLVRPFLGVGVLGGYTTFSTATVDALTLAATGHPVLGLGYLAATPALAVPACALGIALTRRVTRSTA